MEYNFESMINRIKTIKKEKNITNAKLSEISGVPYGTLNKILGSETKEPSINAIIKISKALNVSTDYIINGNEEIKSDSLPQYLSSEKNIIKKYRELDIHGKKIVDIVLNEEYERCTYIEEDTTPKIEISYSFIPASAGTGAFLDEQNIEPREFPDTPESRQADIVIPVDGDSMEPMFYDGDELYVRLQPAVEIGEIGIFEIGDKGYVKKYAPDRLISLNPKYDDIYPDEYNETRCIGKVIGKVE